MKKKEKGFTLIELVLGLSLIVLIILPVFGVILGYKNKEIIESNKADLNSFKSRVLTTIEEEIVKKGIAYTCQYVINDVVDDTKQRLMFRDNTYADIAIEYEQKSIIYTTYNGEHQENTFVLPVQDAHLENVSYIQDKTGKNYYSHFYILPRSANLKKDTKMRENDNSNGIPTILKILIPIAYEDADYSIAITTTFEYKESEDLCGEKTTKEEDKKYRPYTLDYAKYNEKLEEEQ